MLSISLSIFEIIILFVSAIVIGFVINLFFTPAERNEEGSQETNKSVSSGLDEWKLKYINEAEIKDKEITDLKNRLLNAD